MNAPFFAWRLTLLFFAALSLAGRAEESVPADDTRLRAAVTQGLGFLAREGETWMDGHNCNACHHLPIQLWTQREAGRRGFAVDSAKNKEAQTWAIEHSPKIDAGLEMQAFLKLALPDEPQPKLTQQIVAKQLADGSWKPAGQFASMQRRDLAEATENSARIFLLALSTQEADREVAETARAKAAPLLAKAVPPKSTEPLVFRILYARRFGSPEEATELRRELCALQHADGGWGWMIAEPQSDALATGEALYALQQTRDETSVEAVARGQRWLIEQQQPDGGWPIDLTRISKIDRSAPEKAKSLKQATEIYTYWGSAWATLGLLEGLPVTEPKP